MKKSKKITTRILQFFLKFFFVNSLFPYFLKLRTAKNFKRKINSTKKFQKFSNNLESINEHEYKITSQNNEDGIIDFIFSKIPNKKYFIEIGFGYYEFNSLNLIKKGWEGKVIDIDIEESIALKVNLNKYFPKSKVEVINKKVTKDNINHLISKNSFNKEIDFFSLDTDGNDYWILKSMDLSKVNVLCCEYNHWLGKNDRLTIPYDENFKFIDNGIWGVSLLALNDLLNSKGFSLIAVESSGTNAFFIKNHLAKNFEILSPLKSFKSVGRFYNEENKKKIYNNIENNLSKLIKF
tara:strand:+ start:1521 stop:2402 length:882 start_codon:yes stop_codon:yes gene_type:complete